MRRMSLGTNNNGKTIYLSPEIRKLHMQVIGASGKGKSKFLEHMIREDIIENNGFCVIDPHGYLYQDLITWLTTKKILDRAGRHRKKIMLFDPSDPHWTFGFNPMPVDKKNISFYVDEMVKAMAKVWGADNTDALPRFNRILDNVLHVLVEKNLTLLEGRFLIKAGDSDIKSYLISRIKDEIVRDDWDFFNDLTSTQYDGYFESSVNRFRKFLKSPAIRSVIGQTKATINLRKVMDEGGMLFVNLGTSSDNLGEKITDDNSRMLGTLLVNEFLHRAKERPKGSRPFYLYIDECSLFINKDIERILNECRKFGLHLILAHQTLAQLKEAGEAVYKGVMSGAQTKVVFGGLDVEEAELLAKDLFIGELDLEEPKNILDKPVVTGYEIVDLKSRGWGNAHTEGQSQGSSHAGGSVSGSAETFTTVQDPSLGHEHLSTAQSTNKSFSSSWSHTDGYISSDTESYTESVREALKPILKTLPGGLYSLPEQIWKATALVVKQRTQHAIIKIPDKEIQIIETLTVPDEYARPSRIQRLKEQCYELADFVQPRALIEDEIKDRHNRLLEAASLLANPSEPKDYIEIEPPKQKVKKRPTGSRRDTAPAAEKKKDIWSDL